MEIYGPFYFYDLNQLYYYYYVYFPAIIYVWDYQTGCYVEYYIGEIFC